VGIDMAKKNNYEVWRSQYDVLDDREPIEGGNGKVYFVRKDGEILVLKQLKKSFVEKGGETSREKKTRFNREIDIVNNIAKDIPTILPIYAYSKDDYWYVMPLAEGIMEHMIKSDDRFIEAVKLVLDLADGLVYLHNHGVSHRDIKPDNIYFYKDRCCLSDFGIAGLSEQNERLTPSDKQLGAIFTISPEMKRDPLHADGKKADVFSLAKTLWMLIRNDDKGFDGSYDRRNPSIGLSYTSECKGIHLVELEDLLEDATDTDPERRPDMNTFAHRLKIWQEICQDNSRWQDSEWSYLSKALFAGKQASSAIWTDVNAIIAVLREISWLPAYNHIFLPDMGGLDLIGVEPAHEEGCIYLMFESAGLAVVKPKSLVFEGFADANDWNCFLLELENMKPIFKSPDVEYSSEVLVEDTPGHYISADTFVYGVYDYDTGEKLPSEAIRVSRFFRGSFLITLKQGPYNQCVDYAYRAVHDKVGIGNIRIFMSRLREMQNICKEGNYDFRSVINSVFMRNDQRVKEQIKKTNERKDYVSKHPKLELYLQEHLSNWKFECLRDIEIKPGYICYTFFMNLKGYFSLSEGFPEKYKLCSDGMFYNDTDSIDLLQCWTIDDAKAILKSLQIKLNEYLNAAGYVSEFYSLPMINVELNMVRKPIHLITKEEIKELMVKADDRQDNTLVLDGEGYAHIIIDSKESMFYPVCTETWQAGNCYVGKYADVDSQIEAEYALILQGLIKYLRSGRRTYANDSFGNEEDMICEIKELMEE